MSFVRRDLDTTPIVDTVFTIVKKASEAKKALGEEKVVDATIGSLYDEEGSLVAFESVFTPYEQIKKEVKAAYAGSFVGNESFRKQVYEWVVKPSGSTLQHNVIATPGGTGALAITIQSMLSKNETLILPEIGWSSYMLMASMNNLKVKTYTLFEGEHFHMNAFKQTCREVMKEQKKLLVIINDPCHNPTGYSMSYQEWEEVVAFLNMCGKEVPVVLLNDIAYMDYSYDLQHCHDYIKLFDTFNENVMTIIAFSSSKSLTSYGLRCGAAILLAKDADALGQVEIVFEKAARAIWSNVPNAAMDNFTYVTTVNYDAYTKEKAFYIDQLKKRTTVFTTEADTCGLVYYPYREGFFVTIKVTDHKLCDAYHDALMKEHIYTVKVNQGIRVGICSISVKKCKGLAKRMKEILDSVKAV